MSEVTARGVLNELGQFQLDENDVGIASDGKPIQFIRRDVVTGKPIPAEPSMMRDTTRKNATIFAGDWKLIYDEEGYCVTKANMKNLPADSALR